MQFGSSANATRSRRGGNWYRHAPLLLCLERWAAKPTRRGYWEQSGAVYRRSAPRALLRRERTRSTPHTLSSRDIVFRLPCTSSPRLPDTRPHPCFVPRRLATDSLPASLPPP